MRPESRHIWTEEDEKKYEEYKQIVDDFLRPIDDALDKIAHIEQELAQQSEKRKKLIEELHDLNCDLNR